MFSLTFHALIIQLNSFQVKVSFRVHSPHHISWTPPVWWHHQSETSWKLKHLDLVTCTPVRPSAGKWLGCFGHFTSRICQSASQPSGSCLIWTLRGSLMVFISMNINLFSRKSEPLWNWKFPVHKATSFIFCFVFCRVYLTFWNCTQVI